jgi:hypothetical protein
MFSPARLAGRRAFAHLHVALDLDLVGDAEHPGHAGHGVFGGDPLSADAHRAGQEDIALTSGRPDTIGHGAIRCERIVRQLCQGSVIPIVAGRQRDTQEMIHPGHACHPPRRRGRDRFLIAERAKLGSLDDLNQLLRAGLP